MEKLICGHCRHHSLIEGKRICKESGKKVFYVGTCGKFSHTIDPVKFILENKPSYLQRFINFLIKMFKKYLSLNYKMK